MLIVTEYQIKFDPNLKRWIGYRVTKQAKRPFHVTEMFPLTVPKARPHLAARALARALKFI